MVPVRFKISDPTSMTSAGEGSQSTSLDNSNRPIEHGELSVDCLQFEISYFSYFSLSM